MPANAVVKHCNLDVAVTGFDASLVVHKHTHTHKLFIKQCNLLLFNGGHVVQLGKTDLAQLALLFVFFCNFSGLPHFEAQGLFFMSHAYFTMLQWSMGSYHSYFYFCLDCK